MNHRFRCSNTIAFSADGQTMYFCDTPTREIFKFKYSGTGKLAEKVCPFVDTRERERGREGGGLH